MKTQLNPILLTDSYCLSHEFIKIDKGFEVAHFYNRTGSVIFDGLSEIINDILSIKITDEHIKEAEEFSKSNGMPFPRKIWERVVNEFDGYTPVRIQAVPEGTYCPIYTPCIQIRNTAYGMGEMVSWYEGVIMKVYYASGLLTRADEMRRYLDSLKEEYGASILWKFHSFGFRGTASLQDSKTVSTAWNTRLFGTDDFHVNKYIKQDKETIFIGSIVAQAHKVVEQFDDEMEAYKHTISQTAKLGLGICALVIDTYNPYNVINNMIQEISNYAKSLDVHVVLRPDSGDTMQQAVDIYNKVKELGITNVTVIVGDNIKYHNFRDKDKFLTENNVPLNFVSYGMGGGFYEGMTRDSQGWASKLCFSNGEPRMKFSSDDFKISIPNIVHLKYKNNELVVCDGDSDEGIYEDYYEVSRDENGKLFKYMKPAKTREDYVDFSRFVASQDVSQERIILSHETKVLIQQIKEKHGL